MAPAAMPSLGSELSTELNLSFPGEEARLVLRSDFILDRRLEVYPRSTLVSNSAELSSCLTAVSKELLKAGLPFEASPENRMDFCEPDDVSILCCIFDDQENSY